MKNKLFIKVCGNKEINNLEKVCSLQPDFIGFIFYAKSKRFVTDKANIVQPTNCNAKRVGVFVNATENEIMIKINEFQLDYIQLHGNESSEFCQNINTIRPVFKAFQINDKFKFTKLTSYLSACYYFLFDTGSKYYGGSGKKFDWELLKDYNLKKPFILSGGIGKDDVKKIEQINHPKMIGIDLNSGFEIKPGIKDVEKLKNFLNELRI